MIYDISSYYGIDPKIVERTWDVYDYYEHLVFKIHRQKIDEFLIENRSKKIN